MSWEELERRLTELYKAKEGLGPNTTQDQLSKIAEAVKSLCDWLVKLANKIVEAFRGFALTVWAYLAVNFKSVDRFVQFYGDGVEFFEYGEGVDEYTGWFEVSGRVIAFERSDGTIQFRW